MSFSSCCQRPEAELGCSFLPFRAVNKTQQETQALVPRPLSHLLLDWHSGSPSGCNGEPYGLYKASGEQLCCPPAPAPSGTYSEGSRVASRAVVAACPLELVVKD